MSGEEYLFLFFSLRRSIVRLRKMWEHNNELIKRPAPQRRRDIVYKSTQRALLVRRRTHARIYLYIGMQQSHSQKPRERKTHSVMLLAFPFSNSTHECQFPLIKSIKTKSFPMLCRAENYVVKCQERFCAATKRYQVAPQQPKRLFLTPTHNTPEQSGIYEPENMHVRARRASDSQLLRSKKFFSSELHHVTLYRYK